MTTPSAHLTWMMLQPQMTVEALGYIPEFLSYANPKSAKQQIDAAYRGGGGWNAMNGFTLHNDNCLTYPGDPVLKPLAMTRLRDETIVVYRHSWVAIIQPDRSYEVARID